MFPKYHKGKDCTHDVEHQQQSQTNYNSRHEAEDVIPDLIREIIMLESEQFIHSK